MRLVLNCERLLTQVAMNAVGANGILGPPTADWATLSRAVAVGPWEGMRRDHPGDEPSTEKLEACTAPWRWVRPPNWNRSSRSTRWGGRPPARSRAARRQLRWPSSLSPR